MIDRIPACLVALFGTGLYLLTAHPAPDWLDAPELASAAYRLGIFHPPGSPLAVMTGHLAWFWPGGMPAAFSALFAGACLYVLARLVQDLWRGLGPDGRLLQYTCTFLLTAMFALTPGIWSQAVRCEVYTLASFLGLCVLLEIIGLAFPVDPHQAVRRADRIMFLTGMGLAVHPLVALSSLAGVLPLLASQEGRKTWLSPRRLARLGLKLALGAAPLLLLPLMVKIPGDLRWGDPASLSGWLAFVSGSTFNPTFSTGVAGVTGSSLRTLAAVAGGLGFPILLAALPGLYLLGRERWRLSLSLGLVAAAAGLTLILQRSVRLDNPDVSGYALPAMLALFVAAAGFLAIAARILHKLHPRAALVAVLLAGGGLAGYGISIGGSMDRSACHSGLTLAHRSLAHQPGRAVMLLADFNLVFMSDYLTQVHHIRPDVSVVYLRDLDNPELRSALAKADPVLEAHLPPTSAIDGQALAKLAGHRPVALDPGPHLDPAAAGPLAPHGLTWLTGGSESRQGFFDPFAPPLCASGQPKDQRSCDVVTWHAYWQARHALALGQTALGNRLLSVAACASPKDRQVQELLTRQDGTSDLSCNQAPAPGAPGRATYPASIWKALLLLIGLLAWALPQIVQKRLGMTAALGISLTGIAVMGVAVGLG